ncbi:MAG: aminopeptidase P family N-terminal domain-containing protein, partial [Pseudomonadota bacterium]
MRRAHGTPTFKGMFQDFTVRANPAQAARHLPRLRAEMARAELDHFIIPHADEYQNEYTPAYAQRLTWATGFTGSAGAAIIGRETAAMFTDGRYALQVRSEVDGALFSFHDISDCPPAAWLKANLEPGARVGFDPRLHSRAGASALEKACAAAGGALIAM